MRLLDFKIALRVALLCAAKDPLRPQLRGVLIGADTIEATDGHRLVRVRLPGKLRNHGFATRLDVKLYLQRLKLDQDGLYADGFDGPSPAHLPIGSAGDYPETDRLWKMADDRKAPAAEVWIQPRYLATVHRIAKRLSPTHVHAAAVSFGAESDPVLFKLEHDTLEVELLMMPMRKPEHMLEPGFKCADCGHQHQGERFAFICVGCTCPKKSARSVILLPDARPAAPEAKP